MPQTTSEGAIQEVPDISDVFPQYVPEKLIEK
jgi:hypothetical protein